MTPPTAPTPSPSAGAHPPSAGAYPKEARLRRHREVQAVRVRGRRFTGAEVGVRLMPTDLGLARLGLSSPKKYGNAVRRNRFRRVARAAFRQVRSRLGSFDVLVEPKRGLTEPTLAGVAQDLEAAVKTIRR